MPKYLFQARYSPEGARGLLKDGGTARRAETERAISSVGGTLEGFYFAFGATDVFVVADLPDNVSAASLNIAAAATGALSNQTVVLLTAEELDRATKMGASYRPPGG